MRKILSLAAGLVLALVTAAPAFAGPPPLAGNTGHPAVPAQSICVMNAAAADGAHTAAGNVTGVAAHVLFAKSPHACDTD